MPPAGGLPGVVPRPWVGLPPLPLGLVGAACPPASLLAIVSIMAAASLSKDTVVDLSHLWVHAHAAPAHAEAEVVQNNAMMRRAFWIRYCLLDGSKLFIGSSLALLSTAQSDASLELALVGIIVAAL